MRPIRLTIGSEITSCRHRYQVRTSRKERPNYSKLLNWSNRHNYSIHRTLTTSSSEFVQFHIRTYFSCLKISNLETCRHNWFIVLSRKWLWNHIGCLWEDAIWTLPNSKIDCKTKRLPKEGNALCFTDQRGDIRLEILNPGEIGDVLRFQQQSSK